MRWAREGFELLRTFTEASAGVNYLFQEPALRVGEAYGPQVYERLVTLKDRYDPDNFSRLNQNVRPSRLAGWCGEPAARLRAVT